MVWVTRSSGRQGVTLLELIVALTILAAALAVVGPGLGTLIGRDGPRGAADRLAVVLQEARADAARQGQRICIEAVDSSTVRRGSAEESAVRLSGRLVMPARNVGGPASVCFDPSGTATSARWHWSEGGDTAVVRIDPRDARVSVVR